MVGRKWFGGRTCGVQSGHFGNEADPPAMNRMDHRLSCAVVADRQAGRVDATRYACIRNRLT
jgi:hypothetical protein